MTYEVILALHTNQPRKGREKATQQRKVYVNCESTSFSAHDLLVHIGNWIKGPNSNEWDLVSIRRVAPLEIINL